MCALPHARASDEIAALTNEAEALAAAHALSSHRAVLPQLPPLMLHEDRAPAQQSDHGDDTPSTDAEERPQSAVQSRREKKALAARAARKRARERLAQMEHQARVLRSWIAELRSACMCGSSSPTEATANETVQSDSHPSMPPKKRRLTDVPTLIIEDLD
jgi:hypothetical protein